ncbi:hypothetical protein [Mycobacterium sp.]|uniref:hypothetical protein n=1 Tax=Mycobacterium sp. TaxID=1785 RepID=UPI0025E03E58|nr:hypothetical protein [Mycobacterium sp.]
MQRGIPPQQFVDEELDYDGLRLLQTGIQPRWRALRRKQEQPPRCRVGIDGRQDAVEREHPR